MFTTTNHPEKIGLRLLRQNRLSKVISYGLISSANEAKYYLDTHLNGEVKK